MTDVAERRTWIPVCAFLVLGLLSAPSSAAKVVFYKTFFGGTPVCFSGGAFVDNTCSATADGLMASNGNGWLELVLPDDVASAANQSVQYTLNKQGTWSNDYVGTVSLYTPFQTSDTVWLVPDLYPNGTGIKVSTTNPLGAGKVKVVMLWSPWVGETPRIQVGSAWDSMSAYGGNDVLHGWYSQTIVGYTPATTVVFANAARTQYLNGTGLGALATPPIGLDSILSKSDTVWVRAYPEVGATGIRATARRQVPRLLMVFNPWGKFFPAIQQPRIRYGVGDTIRSMQSNADFCGWYSMRFFDRIPAFLLVNRATGQTFGAKGYGDAASIDVSALGDTAWVSVGADSLPRLTSTATGDRGTCEITYLAATVRDFPSGRTQGSALYNREFGRGKGCSEGGWSVVKGLVDSILGADRKPVRSAHDSGENYPNGWTYAFRCSYDALPSGRAEIGDSGIATNWFQTVEGKNAETCRDIPLTIDSVNGNYANNSPRYFPIDDFTTLPSGADNPYYDRIQGEDGKNHNYGFCMESHGNFEYKKGQTFKFRGDDDVWFFINNRLVVDLGGIHPASADSVFLDTIGGVITSRFVNNVQVLDTTWTTARLVEDKTYNFDFFFCERNPQGSSMRIETSMNLRTSNGFQVRDTLLGQGRNSYDLYVSQTSGQGCKAQNLVIKSTGKFLLSGPGIVDRLLPGGGVYYGGITVATGSSRAVVDSALIAGLPAGEYILTAVSDFDSTQTEKFRFVVPFTRGPKFVTKPAKVLATGSSFAVDVGAYGLVGPDSGVVSFVMPNLPGLTFYRDAALLVPVSPTDTFLTGANTLPRRLWVRGNVPGTYTLAVGKIPGDTADLWPSVVFLASRPVFSLRSPWTGTVGGVLPVEVAARNDLGVDSSATVFRLRTLPGIEFYADSLLLRKLLPTDTLVTGTNGMPRRLWAKGTISGTYTFVVTGSAGDSTDNRGPIVFQDKGLRFIDASGAPLAPSAIERPIGDTVRIRFETFAGGTVCTSCGTRVSVATASPGIEFVDANGTIVDAVTLLQGRGSILVRGTAPVSAASLWFQVMEDSTERAVWSPVSITVAGPDSASIHDVDGDGHADLLVVHPHQKWAASNLVALTWPDATSPATLGSPVVSGDSLTVSFPVSGTPLATSSSLVAAGSWAWSVSSGILPFPVADRIAPVPVRAVAAFGTAGSPDTLRILLTESVTGPDVVEIFSGLAFAPTTGTTGSISGNILTLVFPAGAGPHAGDSARLSLAASDILGNHPGPVRRAVVIEAAGPPPARGWLLDLDGDGAMDHARVHFPTTVDPSTLGRFVFRIGPDPLVRDGSTAIAVPGFPNQVEIALATPFPVGVTSFPPGAYGTLHRDNIPTIDGTESRDDAFPLEDSTAPQIRGASLHRTESYDLPDTLVVVATEPIDAVGKALLRHFDGLTESVLSVEDLRRVGADTILVLQWPSRPVGVRVGDSLRWTADGTVSDTLGNIPPYDARRTVVTGQARPPLLRMTPPRSLTRLDEEMLALEPQRSTIQILGGSDLSPRVIDPVTGLVRAEPPCPEVRCVGPSFELNQPVRVSIQVYDRLGVSIVGNDVEISEATLKAIGTDRLDRTHLKVRWDLADARGAPVSSGVYLMRIMVWSTGTAERSMVANKVWTFGVNRPIQR